MSKLSKEDHLYKWLANENIIEKRHCVLRSGRHSDIYIAKTKITLNPALYLTITKSLTQKVVEKYGFYYDIITGPAVAGISFAAPVAVNLGKSFIFPEKFCYDKSDDYDMVYRKEFINFLSVKRVIIIEDVITTGKSVSKTATAIKNSNGIPIAVFCIWNRNPEMRALVYEYNTFNQDKNEIETHQKRIPIYSLISKEIKSWPAIKCCCKKESIL